VAAAWPANDFYRGHCIGMALNGERPDGGTDLAAELLATSPQSFEFDEL
jgi:hypothetical protein